MSFTTLSGLLGLASRGVYGVGKHRPWILMFGLLILLFPFVSSVDVFSCFCSFTVLLLSIYSKEARWNSP